MCIQRMDLELIGGKIVTVCVVVDLSLSCNSICNVSVVLVVTSAAAISAVGSSVAVGSLREIYIFIF